MTFAPGVLIRNFMVHHQHAVGKDMLQINYSF